jgi:hypothetical protein
LILGAQSISGSRAKYIIGRAAFCQRQWRIICRAISRAVDVELCPRYVPAPRARGRKQEENKRTNEGLPERVENLRHSRHFCWVCASAGPAGPTGPTGPSAPNSFVRSHQIGQDASRIHLSHGCGPRDEIPRGCPRFREARGSGRPLGSSRLNGGEIRAEAGSAAYLAIPSRSLSLSLPLLLFCFLSPPYRSPLDALWLSRYVRAPEILQACLDVRDVALPDFFFSCLPFLSFIFFFFPTRKEILTWVGNFVEGLSIEGCFTFTPIIDFWPWRNFACLVFHSIIESSLLRVFNNFLFY